jgi:predicted O-linked N-acetylglucosamine transferase (SPINDLY family)
MELEQTMNRAADHLRAGRLADAEPLLRQVLARTPHHAGALHLLGCVAFQLRRPAEAVDLIRRAIALDPAQAIFHTNLGLALLVMGRKDDAIQAFRQSVKLWPEHPDANNELGNVLCDVGQFDEAIDCYQRAVAARPGDASSLFNLGTGWLRKALAAPPDQDPSIAPGAQRRADDLQEAVQCFQRALALRPDHADSANNLGNALQALGRTDEATAAWQRASAAAPHPIAFLNLGRALCDQDRLEEALVAMQTSFRLRPDQPELCNNLGTLFRNTAQAEEAIAWFDRAIALQPRHVMAHSNRLYTLYYHPDYDPQRILLEHRKWNDQIARPLLSDAGHPIDRSPGRRLRIGYVSPNFWGHCQALFTAPLFSRHDHRQFEIFCYSDVKSPDPFTARVRDWADVWRSTVAMSDEQLAELIRRDRIDILVDLTLHMAQNRMLLFARKPAPVQVTWLGYPGTTGLDTMDYRLTDPYLDPPGETDAFYTEKSVRLPHTFWCMDPEALGASEMPGINPLPALQAGHVTFGCLNNFCKVNQPLLELWSRVLDAVPGSRMVLLAPPGSRRQWVSRTLGDRVDFVSRDSRRNYLQFYHRIDLGLDTLPYNGHTTSIDSLWMGVPVVTLVGRTVVGRAGFSQLSNVGLSELAATTAERFVELAANVAADLPRLTELRRTLRDRTRSSPLMDGERFARDIESAYRQMWLTWCK